MESTPIIREKGGNGNGKMRSNATVNRYLATLSAVFTHCMAELFWMEVNPCTPVRFLREPDGRERMLTLEEWERLKVAANEVSETLYLAIILAVGTGGRKMEVWGMNAKQIEWKRGTVTFDKTKRDVKRTVSIPKDAMTLLRNLGRVGDQVIFPATARGQVGGSFDFRKPFEMALEKAGLEDFSWHGLRQTSASFMVMSGVDTQTLMKIFGWKSEKMASRYVHLYIEHKEEAPQRMAEKFLKI